jgi:hypothetical protein
MFEQIDPEAHRLEQVLQRAKKRLQWMNRSVLDPAALNAAEDLCRKAGDDLVAYNKRVLP